MRWEDLFADLEAELEGLESAELAAEVADRTRRELARIRLTDRLRVATGSVIVVVLGNAGGDRVLRGRLLDSGPDWLLLDRGNGLEVLVPVGAIAHIAGLPGRAAEPGTEGFVQARLGLGHVMRGIARDRTAVTVGLAGGGELTGTIDRVGADYLDLAEHAADEPRRQDSVRAVRTVPFAALALVQRASAGAQSSSEGSNG